MQLRVATLQDRPNAARILMGLLALVVACAAIVYANKAAGNASAILRWRELIQSVARGENVYNEWTKDGSFPNPPVAGLILWPLTLLPPMLAGLSLFALKVLMAAFATRWSASLATGGLGGCGRVFDATAGASQSLSPSHTRKLATSIDCRQFPLVALILVIALASRPMLSDLQHGNINIVVLFLTIAGLVAFQRSSESLAGALIGLATAIKITPALFIPYFAYKRQWRVVGWSLVGLVGFLIVAPSLILGFERNWWLLKSWSGAMVEPYVFEGKVETLQMNQSLPGVWLRLVTESPGLVLDNDDTTTVNVLNMDYTTALWTLKLLLLGLVGFGAWVCRTAIGDRRDWRLGCEYSVVFLAMLLVSERSWKHHYVALLLPFTALVAHQWRSESSRTLKNLVWFSLAAVFLLMASTSTELGGLFMNGRGHKYAQAGGMFCVSALVLFAALSVILRSAHSAASRTVASPD
jgi:alpha-1,2-mannosyltransferase